MKKTPVSARQTELITMPPAPTKKPMAKRAKWHTSTALRLITLESSSIKITLHQGLQNGDRMGKIAHGGKFQVSARQQDATDPFRAVSSLRRAELYRGVRARLISVHRGPGLPAFAARGGGRGTGKGLGFCRSLAGRLMSSLGLVFGGQLRFSLQPMIHRPALGPAFDFVDATGAGGDFIVGRRMVIFCGS
jgi:hypothetical protein